MLAWPTERVLLDLPMPARRRRPQEVGSVNPFHESLEEHLRGEFVRAVANDGTAYRGWVERMDYSQRHLALRDATRLEDDQEVDLGTAFVAHADVVEVIEPESRIEDLALRVIEPAPYHAREFDASENRGYISEVREQGWAQSFPVVRPVEGDLEDPGAEGFEVVEGHKRLWVAEQAGLSTHPVEVVDVDDWSAARRFVADHLPHEGQLTDDGASPTGYYNDAEIEAAIRELVKRWSDRVWELDRVVVNATRLDLDVDVDSLQAAREFVESVEDAARSSRDEDKEAAESDDNDSEADLDQDLDDGTVACDVDGCDFRTDSEQGLAIHQGRVHDQDSEEPNLEERITRLLEEHGELTSSEVADLLDTSSNHYRNVLQSMCRDGRVASRRDPDDRRRHLYRLVDEGPDGPDDDVDEEADQTEAAPPVTEGEDADGGDSSQESVADGGVTTSSQASQDGEPETPDWTPDDGHDGGVDGVAEFSDFGANPDKRPECQTCGSKVQKRYAKVFTPENEQAPRVCPNCEDKIRDSDGTVREARAPRQQGGGGQ